MFDYSKLIGTAVELIDRFGSTVTLTRPATGEYDPATGTVNVTPQNVTSRAVRSQFHTQEIDGANVLTGDVKVLVSPDIALEPQAGDSITLTGTTYRVMRCEEVKPGDSVVLYTVQARA